MHYHAEVYLEKNEKVEEQIAALMAPYDENEVIGQDTFWDWYQIGGRWTGAHTDYDPYTDPANSEKCDICGGTGFRNDQLGRDQRAEDPTYTCNGCGEYDRESQTWKHGPFGPGISLVWSTNFKPYAGDILPIADVKDDLSCATLIVGRSVFHVEKWNGDTFEKTDFDGNVKARLAELGISTGYLVTVDYHD